MVRMKKKVPVYLCSEVKDGKVVNLSFSYSAEDNAYNRILKERAGLEFSSDYLCDIEISRGGRVRGVSASARNTPKLHPQKKWARRIRCIETGKEFKCLSALIKHTGVKRYVLQVRIRDNISINGKHYVYIDG